MIHKWLRAHPNIVGVVYALAAAFVVYGMLDFLRQVWALG